MKEQQTTETVGKKFERDYYQVQSRQAGSGNFFGGMSRYKTLEEAQAAIEKTSQRFTDIGGGFTIDTGPATDLFEYRVVHVVSQCEVVHVETRKI